MVEMYKGSDTLGLFKPYSYDELLKLPKEETEAQMKAQDAYNTLQAEIEARKAILASDKDSAEYKQVDVYSTDLSNKIDDLVSNGLSTNSLSDFQNIRETYNTTIKPIENAQDRKALLFSQQVAEQTKDPSLVFNVEAEKTPIGAYVANPYLQSDSISLNQVLSEGKELNTVLSMVNIHNKAEMETTSNIYKDFATQNPGFTAEEIMQARRDPEGKVANRLLEQQMNYMLKKYGVVDFDPNTGAILRNPDGSYVIADKWKSNPDIVRRVKDQIQQSWEYAIGKQTVTVEDSPAGVRTAHPRSGGTTPTDYDLGENDTHRISIFPDEEDIKEGDQQKSNLRLLGYDFTTNKIKDATLDDFDADGAMGPSASVRVIDANGSFIPFEKLQPEVEKQLREYSSFVFKSNTVLEDVVDEVFRGGSKEDYLSHLNEHVQSIKRNYEKKVKIANDYSLKKTGKPFNAFRQTDLINNVNQDMTYKSLVTISQLVSPTRFASTISPGCMNGDDSKDSFPLKVCKIRLDKYGVPHLIQTDTNFTFDDFERDSDTKVLKEGGKVEKIDVLGEGVVFTLKSGRTASLFNKSISSGMMRKSIQSINNLNEQLRKGKISHKRYNQLMIGESNRIATNLDKLKLTKKSKQKKSGYDDSTDDDDTDE